MIGEFAFKLAVETPDGALSVFNAPTPWAPGTLYVVLNGLVQTSGFSFPGGTQVQFDSIPQVGDVVGFFYNLG